MSRYSGLRLLLLASSVLTPGLALAQSQPAGTSSVSSNLSLEAGVVHTDNLYATENQKVGETIYLLKPQITASRTTAGGAISFSANAEVGRHDQHSSEDYTDWSAALGGRTKLGSIGINGGLDYGEDHESRSSPEAVSGLEPTTYSRGNLFGALAAGQGDWRIRLGATATRLDFNDTPTSGGVINNDDRDRTASEFGGRVVHRLSGGAELFVQGAYDRREYADAVDDFGFMRDSDGYSAAFGLARPMTGGWRYEAFAGVMRQDYADPALKAVGAYDVGGLLDWTSRSGTGVNLRLDRSIEDTTLPGASAYILSRASVNIQQDIAPRLAAGLGFGGANYEYVGVNRNEFVTTADVWGRYWFTPHAYVGLEYALAQRASNAAGYDFDENRLSLTLGGQLRPRFTGDQPAFGALTSHTAPAGGYFVLLAGHGGLTTGLTGPRGPGTNTADFGGFGMGGGLAAGYGVTAGDLYAGLELDAYSGGAGWDHNADRIFSVDRQGSYGLSGRVGLVTSPGALIYAKAGVVQTDFDTAYLHSTSDVAGDWRQTGYAIGVGIEADGAKHTFVRAEYTVASYPDYDVPTSATTADNFANAESLFRVGFGMRFADAKPAFARPADFGGAYVGLYGGHGALSSFNTGARSGGTAIAIERSADGPVAGVIAGYGLQEGPIYVGAELEAGWSGVGWNIERDPTGRIYSVDDRSSLALSGRLGWRVGPSSLSFISIGAVQTRFFVDYQTSGQHVTAKPTVDGVRVGAGLETALTPRSHVRVDYVVTDFSAFDLAYGANADGFDNTEAAFRIAFVRRIGG